MKYQVKDCGYGNGLFAGVTICAGEVIDQFNGYETAYSSLSDEQKRLVFYLGDGRCFVITNELVFVNHACEPNCRIKEDALIALYDISAGEQLTFSYNVFSRERLADGYADWWWDPLWNFDCRCESLRCQGRIEGYQFIEAN
jgi:SET domain-containing protein